MYIDTDAANKGGKPKIAVSSSRINEESPLLESFVGQAPPPTYLEATTPNPWNQRPSGDEGARLLSFDGRPDAEEGMSKGLTNRRRSFRDFFSRKRILKWLGVILFLIVFAAIVASIAGRDKSKPVSPIPVPAQPASSSLPQESFPIRWPTRCGKKYKTKTEQFSYDTSAELNINENVHQLDGPFKRISGWIHIAKAASDQAAGTIQAKFSYAVSDSVDINSIAYVSSATGLTVGDTRTPDGFDGVQADSTACLGISVVIYMAEGAKLDNLNIESVHLGMQIHSGVDFSVANSTSISLTTGTLDASTINSRETRLKTVSGSISGKYALRDLLSITTESGSVNVNVEPKEVAGQDSKTALFHAKSVAGSIRADFERRRIPERDYQVTIDTIVGSVDGTFIHGSKTEITTVAGGVNADIMPFQSGDYASTLKTSTSSGQTVVNIRAPYRDAGSRMNGLTAEHKTISGALNATYPQEWEGTVVGSSVDGALHLQGNDLELIKREEKPGSYKVEAKKGTGKSKMAFETVSGGCEVMVGNV